MAGIVGDGAEAVDSAAKKDKDQLEEEKKRIAEDPNACAGFFFDGTNNDMLTDEFPTHIYTLLKLYDKFKYYVNGVGTRDLNLGYQGETAGNGATARLIRAYRMLEIFYSGGIKKVDIFGFSRGSAMAREFANMIDDSNNNTNVCVMKGFTNDGKRTTFAMKPLGKKVTVRFLGLFDTVAQFGFVWDDNDNTSHDIRLGIKGKGVGYTAHAVARNEYRHLFPGTSLVDYYKKANINERKEIGPDYYREFKGPDFHEKPFVGAHSDIGGGYEETNTNALKWMIKKARDNGVPFPEDNTDRYRTFMSRHKLLTPTHLDDCFADCLDNCCYVDLKYRPYHDSRYFFALDKDLWIADARYSRYVYPGNLTCDPEPRLKYLINPKMIHIKVKNIGKSKLNHVIVSGGEDTIKANSLSPDKEKGRYYFTTKVSNEYVVKYKISFETETHRKIIVPAILEDYSNKDLVLIFEINGDTYKTRFSYIISDLKQPINESGIWTDPNEIVTDFKFKYFGGEECDTDIDWTGPDAEDQALENLA